MKLKSQLYINVCFLMALFFLFATCQKENTNVVVPTPPSTPSPNTAEEPVDTVYYSVEGIKVSNGKVEKVSFTKVEIEADYSVFELNTFTIEDYGHVVSKSTSEPTIENNDGLSSLGLRENKGIFKSEIEGLSPGNSYNARVYIKAKNKSSGNTTYSYHPRFISFNTLAGEEPELTIKEPNDITNSSFKTESTIVDFKELDIIQHGFVWSTSNSSPTLENNNGKVEFGALEERTSHDFNSTIEGLTGGTTYYYRAFAQNLIGTGYSSPKEVMTLPSPKPNIIISGIEQVSDSNNSGEANPGETVSFQITIQNIGNEIASNVIANLSTTSTFTSFLQGNSISFGNIFPNETKSKLITLSVKESTPWDTDILILAEFTDNNQDSWIDDFQFQVVSPIVVLEGLSFYLPFNECSGNKTTDLIYENKGDLFGPSFSNDNPSNEEGCSISFKNSSISPENYHINFALNPFNGQRMGSIAFWMKTTSDYFYIFEAQNSGIQGAFYLRVFNHKFHIKNTIIDYNLSSFLDGKWHHFVLTTSDNGTSVYIDSSLKVTSNWSSWTLTNYNGFVLGAQSNIGGQYSIPNANFDNFRIYNRALTIEEINKIFEAKQ